MHKKKKTVWTIWMAADGQQQQHVNGNDMQNANSQRFYSALTHTHTHWRGVLTFTE